MNGKPTNSSESVEHSDRMRNIKGENDILSRFFVSIIFHFLFLQFISNKTNNFLLKFPSSSSFSAVFLSFWNFSYLRAVYDEVLAERKISGTIEIINFSFFSLSAVYAPTPRLPYRKRITKAKLLNNINFFQKNLLSLWLMFSFRYFKLFKFQFNSF